MYQNNGIRVLFILPFIFFTQLFTSPLLEELGWRGYLLPMLQQRFSALAANTIVGLIWGVWHLPLIIAYKESVLLVLLTIVAHSIMMGWLFNSSKGNMLMMLLFHASLNISQNTLLLDRNDPMYIVVSWVAVIAIIAFYKPNNLSTHPRIKDIVV
ncbi:hypothetical protein GCM10028809_60740 [Spirosoma gilvum]